VVLIVATLASVLPLVWTMLSSFKTVGEIFRFPPTFFPESGSSMNYELLFQTMPFLAWVLNSAGMMAIALVVTIVTCTLAGYAFAKFKFVGSKLLYLLVLAALALPFAVLLTTLYKQTVELGFTGSPLALAIPFLTPPLGVIIMRQFTATSVPDEILEAARIDGAGEFRIFLTIVFPLVAAGTGALAIWAFFHVYSQYLWPIVIAITTSGFTLPAGVGALANSLAPLYGVTLSAAVLTAIPPLLLLFIIRNQVTRALTAGAVKG
jgi:ABC-type glycerol-3-phosphate transport system permease component